MEQKLMETFKVIGQCSKTQTLSLDQETKLWEGIPYEINFFQDFSRAYLDGWPIEGISVPTLIEAIVFPSGQTAPDPKEITERERQTIWEAVEEQQKQKQKCEKKWKKKHQKLSEKEALRNHKRTVDRILGGW